MFTSCLEEVHGQSKDITEKKGAQNTDVWQTHAKNYPDEAFNKENKPNNISEK